MSLEHLSNLYYTAEQARKKLGMTKDAFNHYVKTGVIKKTTVVGKHGHFMKRDIDMLAMSIDAAMIAAQSPDVQFKKATLDQLDEEVKLAIQNYGERTIAFNEQRQLFLQTNPDMSYYLYDGRFMVASINVLPLTHEGILKFCQGERGWNLGEYIEQFKPGKPLEIIIIDMLTTTLVPPSRRSYYALHLLFGLARLLEQWGKQGLDFIKVYGCGSTLDGIRNLESAGFTRLGEPTPRRVMYELDIATSDLHLLLPYKEAIAAYKAKGFQE